MRILIPMLMTLGLVLATYGDDPKPVYENNFEKAEVSKVPDDMMVLDGAFTVKEEAGNKFLELPGAPLETFGVLFGPTDAAGLSVNARIHSTGKGRRFPTFGLGLNGVGGYRLQVAPAKKLIELYKGDEILTNAPFVWTTDSWTVMRLQSLKTKSGQLKIEGFVWKQGDAEPKAALISWSDKPETPAGRPSLWGNPFAGTPIQFDDLKVSRIAE